MDNFKITIKSKKVKKLVKINLLISFITCVLAIIMLAVYNAYYISIYLFKSSIIVFRTGLFIGTFSIICGIFFENYLNCD